MRKLSLLFCIGLMSGAAGPAAFDPAAIAGRYGRHFLDATVDGQNYGADDVLEIVKLDPRRAYIRARVNFYNGHECTIFGIAHVEGGELVYRDPKPYFNGTRCILHVRKTGGGVRLEDSNSCRADCGARGSLNGVDFDRRSRRPITYMERLKRSSEYRDALAEDRGEKTK
jgi:hypothetical protein